MRFAVVYHKTRSGFSAEVPDLPGCVAAGRTKEQTRKLMQGAIKMHLDGMKEDGEPIPEPSTQTEYIAVRG